MLSDNPISSQYFIDGVRPIDLVLVWDEFDEVSSSKKCAELRKVK